MLVTESKPMYEKKTIADPANIPFTPYGKYLRYKRNFSYIKKRHAIDEELNNSESQHPLPAGEFISNPSGLET